MRRGARETPAGVLSGLFRLGLKVFLSLAPLEVVLTGVLTMVAKLRTKRREAPRESFPRKKQPEIELESSDERFKLYLVYEGLGQHRQPEPVQPPRGQPGNLQRTLRQADGERVRAGQDERRGGDPRGLGEPPALHQARRGSTRPAQALCDSNDQAIGSRQTKLTEV